MDLTLNAQQLYVRYAPMVLRRCIRLLGDESSAADITQEVFLKIWEKQTSTVACAPVIVYGMGGR